MEVLEYLQISHLIKALMNDTANWGDWASVSAIGLLLLSSLSMALGRGSKKKEETSSEAITEKTTETTIETPVEKPLVESWSSRLTKGLSKTRNDIWGKVQGLLGNQKLDEETLDQVEELLYSADMSASSIEELLESMKKNFDHEKDDFKGFVKDFFKEKLSPYHGEDKKLFQFEKSTGKTKVIMIVGVNGAGKTTTIGKLATKLQRQGASVVVGACDTFRAAAIEQLEVWCERAGVELIKTKSGADPSGVAYETLKTALASKADYCLLDTAGRLHTKTNLMDELNKTKRVLTKLDENAPHETLLVIDSITGQNAMRQAEEFNKYLGLSGLILTKCDGSSKAGNAVSMVEMLKVPIVSIGVGEDVDDLNDFEVSEYLNALIG